MKIGLLCCFYNCAEDVDKLLAPWRNISNCIISIVHGQFKEYHDLGYPDEDIATIEKLKVTPCNYLYVQNGIYESEAEIRDKGLRYLISQNVDIVILIDSDEFYTEDNVKGILSYIEHPDNDLYAWYSINFKNYVFDCKQWLDGFHPPRVFRTKYNSIAIDRFYWDNDILYKNGEIKCNYKDLPSKEIPKRVAHVKHITWTHENGKKKVEYQNRHFGTCSYRWDEQSKQLAFNEDYYLKNRLPLPITKTDD
jgi:hypothetical protein